MQTNHTPAQLEPIFFLIEPELIVTLVHTILIELLMTGASTRAINSVASSELDKFKMHIWACLKFYLFWWEHSFLVLKILPISVLFCSHPADA